jgi:hypothetical protein
MIRLISATARQPFYVDPAWVTAVEEASTTMATRLLVDGQWFEALGAPASIATALGKPGRSIPVADILAAATWAASFFAISQDDDVSDEEAAERAAGEAAIERLRAWLEWER